MVFSCGKKPYADPIGRAVKGVGLRSLTGWECGFESRQGTWMSRVSVVVLSGRGLYDGPFTRSEASYRVWCVGV